ncbi:zinc ribbon domain-containing protein [uncultured Methylobacterium sp.]|uniref:zinc ribbon domain-containing protein n=1 Tax=uncultured Methylobacterium sp. TaxID=157278 RepID=UPI0025974532|nr:zinc ribbon domain-containing protein [uncultured Methylobacterium sp.]
MTLTRCPDCTTAISGRAASCPHCGRPLATVRAPRAAGFEYRSGRTLFGWPLVHVIADASDNGTLQPARGILAVGNVAIGLVAFGGIAVGGIALGGVALGPVSLGGVAIGLLFGAGGIASGYWALGGVALGATAIGGVALGLAPGTGIAADPGLARPSKPPDPGTRS